MDGEPLNPGEAKALIRRIASTGNVIYVKPKFAELLKQRNLSTMDVQNVLMRGRLGEAEWENGAWRYPVFTNKIHVVVEFSKAEGDDDCELMVITAWRL